MIKLRVTHHYAFFRILMQKDVCIRMQPTLFETSDVLLIIVIESDILSEERS